MIATGQCSGLGIYFFADGSQYQGAWNHGKYASWTTKTTPLPHPVGAQDGAGILYSASGDRERLTYFEGRLMKREVLPPGHPPAVQNKSRPPGAQRPDHFGAVFGHFGHFSVKTDDNHIQSSNN